jgi:hypothetical protein
MKRTSFQVLIRTLLAGVPAALLGFLEYRFILHNNLPYKLFRQPIGGILFDYQLVGIIPLLFILAFQPNILDVALSARGKNMGRREIALSMGVFLLCLIIQDLSWFMSRVFYPLVSDPSAHKFIKISDHSSTVLGYAKIGGVVIPVWYLVLIPIIIALLFGVSLISRD